MRATKHGLTRQTLEEITAILARYSQLEKAVLFGSRAKGSHERGSDIDLALVGDGIDRRMIGAMRVDFDDSSLPYRVSLVPLDNRTDPDLAEHVHRVGVPIYVRAPVLEKPA